MPDLDLITDEMFEQKLNELLDHYKYEVNLPEIDTILSGVTTISVDQVKSSEISVLYDYLISLLSCAEQKASEAIVPVQISGYLKNVIKTLNLLYGFSPEVALLGEQILIHQCPILYQAQSYERISGTEEVQEFKNWAKQS